MRFKNSKTCVKQPLSKRPKIDFQDQLSLNAGRKYCRMLQGEHSAILLTFIMLPFVIKIFVLSIFEWPFYTGFTVYQLDNSTASNNFTSVQKSFLLKPTKVFIFLLKLDFTVENLHTAFVNHNFLTSQKMVKV